MQKKIVGIDIDDVLFDFNTGLCEYHNDLYGTTLRREDIIDYDLENLWGCSANEVAQRIEDFYRSTYHQRLNPLDGAVHAVKTLEALCDISVITARPTIALHITMELIESLFPRFSGGVHFLRRVHGPESRRETKGDICERLGVQIFCDDAIRHAASVCAKGIPVLLFDSPWNQGETPAGAVRVYGWKDALPRLIQFLGKKYNQKR
ncbi:hypothetical protein L0Y49_00110 [bacterium]|nr:hypothetical protein [bacterium]MCI0566435.1 hypothetical protein [bacterium]